MENGKLNFVTTKLVRDKTIGEGKIIGSKDEAISFMEEHLADCDKEYFVVLNLDVKLKVLNANIASIGGLNGTITHPREIFKTSILSNARNVILFHNHPSGDPEPSKEDVDVTNSLIKAGKLLGIEVNDHIVVGNGKHISLRETEAANFYNIDQPNISELDEWDTLYERDKILKQEDAFSVERNIDGLPYKFDLSVDEISKLYEKFQQKQDVAFEKNEENKEMEDKKVILEALKNGDMELRNVSDELKADEEVVLAAIYSDQDEMKYADNRLRSDKEFLLKAIKVNGFVLEYVNEDVLDDKEFMLKVVKNNDELFSYASDRLRNDREIVLVAVKHNGELLGYASATLANDKEVVLEAIKNSGYSLKYASEELKNDKEFLLKAIEVNPDCKKLAESYLRNDKPQKLQKGDIIETALGKNTMVLDVEGNHAVLFSGKQFVIASGIKMNEKDGKFEWSSGQYADNFGDIANIKNKDFATMKDTISSLSDMYHKDFVKSVVSIETGLDDDLLLDDLYDTYLRSDDMKLVSDEIYDLAKDMKALEKSKLHKNCDIKMGI